ncbi:MAG: DUF4845 domain-containing protein [Arenicellales bacterium]
MNNTPEKQQGASLIAIVITLAIIGILVFFSMQYVPQYMETGKVNSVLDGLEKDHADSQFTSTRDIEQSIANKLNINEMNDMMSNVTVKKGDSGFIVNIKYERELNMIYEKKPVMYDRTVILN